MTLSLLAEAIPDSVATLRIRVREANGFDAEPTELTVRTRPLVPALPAVPAVDPPIVIPPPVVPPSVPPRR